jgi:hypothetical protein
MSRRNLRQKVSRVAEIAQEVLVRGVDEEVGGVGDTPRVDHAPLAEQHQRVEQAERLGGGLVHGGHHGAVCVDHLAEGHQQHGGLVQGHPRGGLVNQQQLGAVHHLLRDGQALVLALVEELHFLLGHTAHSTICNIGGEKTR